ncbi:hypothetical protein EUTSA_v10012408mg [Eutrema salsugineum]|uniref:Uncharacterized protein n=1 Tax=Eutrema salsugineum TaxID=72664 RepID=V4KL55_EUTSA|nr:hypothetical protein EUTSA_v10012408mg [Eutrema salsugineum]
MHTEGTSPYKPRNMLPVLDLGGQETNEDVSTHQHLLQMEILSFLSDSQHILKSLSHHEMLHMLHQRHG